MLAVALDRVYAVSVCVKPRPMHAVQLRTRSSSRSKTSVIRFQISCSTELAIGGEGGLTRLREVPKAFHLFETIGAAPVFSVTWHPVGPSLKRIPVSDSVQVEPPLAAPPAPLAAASSSAASSSATPAPAQAVIEAATAPEPTEPVTATAPAQAVEAAAERAPEAAAAERAPEAAATGRAPEAAVTPAERK